MIKAKPARGFLSTGWIDKHPFSRAMYRYRDIHSQVDTDARCSSKSKSKTGKRTGVTTIRFIAARFVSWHYCIDPGLTTHIEPSCTHAVYEIRSDETETARTSPFDVLHCRQSGLLMFQMHRKSLSSLPILSAYFLALNSLPILSASLTT